MPRREDDADMDKDLQDIEARETLAADEVPEVDAASDDADLELSLEAHATEDIVGDVDGDDYRAGTLDPEGSDRGPRGALIGERLGDSPPMRR
jgi:hypothetical protein